MRTGQRAPTAPGMSSPMKWTESGTEECDVKTHKMQTELCSRRGAGAPQVHRTDGESTCDPETESAWGGTGLQAGRGGSLLPLCSFTQSQVILAKSEISVSLTHSGPPNKQILAEIDPSLASHTATQLTWPGPCSAQTKDLPQPFPHPLAPCFLAKDCAFKIHPHGLGLESLKSD